MTSLDKCPFCKSHKFIYDNKMANINELGHSWITKWFYNLYHKPEKK